MEAVGVVELMKAFGDRLDFGIILFQVLKALKYTIDRMKYKRAWMLDFFFFSFVVVVVAQ